MKEVQLLYGTKGLSIKVPDDAVIVEPTHVEGLPDEEKAVMEALHNPIGCPSLPEMVKPTDQVAIVISDITRPTPNHKLVPWLIKALPHVPHENFVIINGTGTHRDQTEEEFRQMMGDWVVDHIKIVNNHCFEKESLIKVGESSFGCEAYLNKEYVEADFRIVTGFIEPHFFAGFSGGPKGILPGIAGIDTIEAFHNARMIGDPKSTWGNINKNPLQEMAREVNHMCKPHFMLNVTLNADKAITRVFAGELFEAHAEGCAFVKSHAMIRCNNHFDVVITTNSGYPLDQNLYQAVKGISAAHQIVKEGGTIICAAECSDGLPEHGNYAKILKLRETPEQILEMINDPAFKMFDQWTVQKQAVIQGRANLYLYSSLSVEDVRNAKMTPTTDIEKTLEALTEKYGPNMSVAVLPLGPLSIPYVEA